MPVEHRSLEARIGSLRGLLRGIAGGEPQAERAAHALRDLERFARDLAEHFAGEELPEGLFAQALAAAPRLDRRVVALQEQHARLAEEIRRIVEDAGYAGLSAVAWRRLNDAFDAFAEELRGHEREENRIASDAYLEDLGAGD